MKLYDLTTLGPHSHPCTDIQDTYLGTLRRSLETH